MELPFDAIAGGGNAGDAPIARPPGNALNSRASHQQFHRLVADRDAPPKRQIGMDTPDAVGAAGRAMHLADHAREPGVPDGAGGRRSGAPGIVAGLGHLKHATGELH